MSLLSPETLHVFLSPTTLLALSRVGWRRRVGKTRSYAVTRADDTLWQGVLPAFAAALKDFGGNPVHVLLSHHFVQYRVLPWRDELRGDEEYRALAQLEFASTFGSLAHDWTVCLSDEKPGASRVAAAIPSGLLSALLAAATTAGRTLDTVQTCLAGAVGVWQKHLPRQADQWLLLHEPGRLCVAVKQQGDWRWLRHLKVNEDWVSQLPRILEGEELLAGLEAPGDQVQVFAPGAGAQTQEALSASGFHVLAVPSARGVALDGDAAFAPLWLA